MAVSVHHGKVGGKLWLNDEDAEVGSKYMDCTDIERSSMEMYYDNMAKDYSKAVRAWGYCMPELLTDALIQHGRLDKSRNQVKVN